MERNRNKSMGGGVNGLTTEVVLEMHGNVIDEQAGFPGLLTQYEPQTRGVHTHTGTYTGTVCTTTGAWIQASQHEGEHTPWLAWDTGA